ncbi:MAG: ATP-binding cassette domain-containing protein [Eggerthellaceae bacterium]|nr:ATP-binding cassette domain-containing protein [Eggerthellaceae bacterium]
MLELKDICLDVVADEGTGQKKRILDNISLEIGNNSFVVITGQNGGGKSSLGKIIMGIEKPSSGKIIFNGEDISALSISEVAKLGIAYAFQQPPCFKGLKIKKILEIAAGHKLPMLSCNEFLSKVGLCSANYLTRDVDNSLSGGELKRIEIASVLARDPVLAIYDEPEAGIDLWSFDRLISTFKEVHNSNNDKSIVIISHQERIISLADEVVLLNAGKIDCIAKPNEIMEKLCIKKKDMPGCNFTQPTQLHITDIPTTC